MTRRICVSQLVFLVMMAEWFKVLRSCRSLIKSVGLCGVRIPTSDNCDRLSSFYNFLLMFVIYSTSYRPVQTTAFSAGTFNPRYTCQRGGHVALSTNKEETNFDLLYISYKKKSERGHIIIHMKHHILSSTHSAPHNKRTVRLPMTV